jgi:hypothetical protein
VRFIIGLALFDLFVDLKRQRAVVLFRILSRQNSFLDLVEMGIERASSTGFSLPQSVDSELINC